MRLRPFHLERARLCADAYGSPAPAWEAPGLCRAFFAHDSDRSVVTFEGTRPKFIGDWIVDLDQQPLHLDPALGALPDGFGRAVLSILFRVMRQIPPETPVDFNGHSMGGSNALIAAAIWKHAGRRLGSVSAFEAARVGSLGGLLLGEDVLITTHGRDPVPELPLLKPHPVEPVHLTPVKQMDPIQDHAIENVAAAIAAVLNVGKAE
jgi:hypothetical protein